MSLTALHKGVEHNHSQCYVDQSKVNNGVKKALKEEVSRRYRPVEIHRNMQGMKWTANQAALDAAGGLIMNLKTVHNSNREFLEPKNRGWINLRLAMNSCTSLVRIMCQKGSLRSVCRIITNWLCLHIEVSSAAGVL